ncbi:S24 family peptidase [Bradyrhizobium lablabi]|nr:helix-turn-helix transcriptional regulator [Bradyrhizobium lablabi]
MSENDCIPDSIHGVSRLVNTARIKNIGTVRIGMAGDDRDEVIQARAQRLKAYREAAGFRFAAEAARRYRWVEPTYRSHENGTRPIGDDDADRYAIGFSRPGRKITGKDIMYGPAETPADPSESGILRVPVVGMIGAGAVVEPEFEQVPEGGIYEVELPYAVPEDLIAFQVEGDSMMPRYDDGDVILVWKDQKRSLESFYGEEAAVRTHDGRRYIKTILYGKTRQTVNLQSFNAKLIEGVRIEWIGEIYSTIRAGQVHRLTKRDRARKPVAKRPSAAKGAHK